MLSRHGPGANTGSDNEGNEAVTRIMFLLIALLVAASWASVAQAHDGEHEQVCPPLDSGKIDVVGDHTSVTVTAPEGMVIVHYCVKAGSENQGDGPVEVHVDPPATTITITHPSGKDISHYSLEFDVIDNPTPPPPHDEDCPDGTTPREIKDRGGNVVGVICLPAKDTPNTNTPNTNTPIGEGSSTNTPTAELPLTGVPTWAIVALAVAGAFLASVGIGKWIAAGRGDE